MRRLFLMSALISLAVGCNASNQVLLPGPGSLPQVLYAGDAGSTFRVFALPLAAAPTASVALTGFGFAMDAVTDQAGHVFVLDNLPTPPVIDEYTRPLTASSTTIARISVTGKSSCGYLTIDSGGNLWVSCFSGGVVKINGPFTATGSYSGTIGATLSGIGTANQLAFDAAGDLFVADVTNGTIDVFQAPVSDGHSPSGTLTIPSATSVAVDTTGNVYGADYADHSLLRWNAPVPLTTAGVAASVTDSGVTSSNSGVGPRSLGFDGSGNLYVGSCNTAVAGAIDVFNIPTSGFTSSTMPALRIPLADCVWGLFVGSP